MDKLIEVESFGNSPYMKRDNADVELSKDEYGFFFQMLMPFAIEFYNNGQTRDTNEGFLGMLMRGDGPANNLGVSMSIGITSQGTYDFPPELCEVLSQPKFGCVFA